MRALVVTWDGAGNLPPTLAILSALKARNHEVLVLAHDSQKEDILSAGGDFRSYPAAPQIDQGKSVAGFDFNAWFRQFNDEAAMDFMELALAEDPNVIIIDSMMGPTISAAWSTGTKIVALVHAAYSFMAPWKESIDAADLILNCSYEDFDKGAKFPRKMKFVGPLRPAAKASGTPWQRKFPDRPLVIASLSTGVQGPFQLGLLQRIADSLSSLPVEGLITTGRGIAPEEITAEPNVTVARNIDHSLTLPEATLFITHAGHGSVMAALRAGVPMLCMPPIVDQPHNAKLLNELGLGETIDVMAPVSVITETANRMLNDNDMQKAAKKFAKKKTFDPKPEDAAKAIEKLAK